MQMISLVRCLIEFSGSDHFYHHEPSLRLSKNNLLVLLIWSRMVAGHPIQILSEWAVSDDGLSLYPQLIRDVQSSHPKMQLALNQAALLCYKQLLPYHPTDSTQSIRGSYLSDYHDIVNGKLLSNERAVFDRMLSSILRVLKNFTDGFQNICELLATVLQTPTPILHRFDGISDEYWLHRMSGLTHENAFGMTNIQHVLEAIVARGVDGEEDWVILD
jgi:hypothetical protein